MPDREAFVEKLEARMHEWSARFEDLKARVRKVASARRAEHAEQIAALQARRDEVKEKIRQLREAGGHAWEELREAAEKTWGRDVRRARRSRFPASCPLCVEVKSERGARKLELSAHGLTNEHAYRHLYGLLEGSTDDQARRAR